MKKRILQLSNYYYPEIGGIEKIAQSISDGLRDEYEVKVICFTHRKQSSTERIDGTEVMRCGTKVKVASQQLTPEMISCIKWEMRIYKPDAVIIHMPNPFLETILLRYLTDDCKLIVYWHSDIVKQRIGKILFSGLTKMLLDRANTIVATSPNYISGSADLRKYSEKCVVIPNCIDEDQLAITDNIRLTAEKIRKENENKHICICVGRQVPYKGFEYAIEAVNSLNDDYVLYIIGREGESTKLLKLMAVGSPRIRFIGEVDGDTLYAYMLACDIFCFPSVTKNEAFGIALAEGMYFGKPAVTFTIPGSGVNFVSLNGVTGIEVENRNAISYAEAIRTLSEDVAKQTQYGIAAKERVEELFLKKQFGENIKELIRTLV